MVDLRFSGSTIFKTLLLLHLWFFFSQTFNICSLSQSTAKRLNSWTLGLFVVYLWDSILGHPAHLLGEVWHQGTSVQINKSYCCRQADRQGPLTSYYCLINFLKPFWIFSAMLIISPYYNMLSFYPKGLKYRSTCYPIGRCYQHEAFNPN